MKPTADDPVFVLPVLLHGKDRARGEMFLRVLEDNLRDLKTAYDALQRLASSRELVQGATLAVAELCAYAMEREREMVGWPLIRELPSNDGQLATDDESIYNELGEQFIVP